MNETKSANYFKACLFSEYLYLHFDFFACFTIQYFDHTPLIKDNFMCVCVLVKNLKLSKRILATQILMVFYVGVYVTVIGMYMHIYFSVPKSAQRASNKLETSLGKRISIIVFSNMTFYAVPNRLIVVYTAANINKYLPSEDINFVLRIWLPPVCMIRNACLNLSLFAFRNEQFLTSLMHFARRVISSVCALKKTAFTKPFI